MTNLIQPMLAPAALDLGDEGFPLAVARLLGSKTPKTLYCQGNLALLGKPAVGFCGSRKASEKGLRVAADCATQLAQSGIVVVSGYAAGVDYAAHKAAFEAGGSTILVLPEGIEHFRIRKTLVQDWDWDRALVISQFPPSAGWKTYRAMERNTLIIALSRAMIVIEAGATGGTLHAGESTLKMGLPLYVVEYGDMANEAPGNAVLIAKGGIRVRKNPQLGVANVEAIRQAASKPLVVSSMQSASLPLAFAT
ncbi:DNA protecting protein DprA [Humidesulfovibrio mexicanus]|uniref:DNA protecting protein DprA n=1 Tax=Humidesulfovibrio mexicanus TaxID=147047 RepID=A0A239BW44_9BACT|nr:DNA-processing protein DprA [Humidesulfovibrio mexicanus]SNS12227.1 DNA protecting protein DprA [Humidesulfovibrio mexicanus]